MIALTVVAFALAWWLGLYVIARDPRKPVLRRTGAGLLAYAAALACAALRSAAPGRTAADVIGVIQGVLVYLPALAWTGVLVLLLPEAWVWQRRLDRIWRLGLVPLVAVALAAATAGDLAPGRGSLTAAGPPAGLALGGSPAEPASGESPAGLALAALVLAPLAIAFGLVVARWRTLRPSGVGGLLIVATLFFVLGVAVLPIPLGWPPRGVLLAGVGVDLALLGVAVARFDAFAEGEALRADLRRSLITAGATTLLFGSQVGAAMLLSAGGTLPLTALLFGTVAAAILVQVLNNPLSTVLDRAAFPGDPQLQHARAELRDVADALPRRGEAGALADLDETEFVRLTRRALSHYGDLGKLVNNPLTGLPAIDERLAARGAADQPLERATELKALLLESIARLKPRTGEFGTSDEWRYYNALFYSYVVGIRPYSRRARHDRLDPDARRALEWFARHVPERTLYNWQNAAAKVVATDLRAGL